MKTFYVMRFLSCVAVTVVLALAVIQGYVRPSRWNCADWFAVVIMLGVTSRWLYLEAREREGGAS